MDSGKTNVDSESDGAEVLFLKDNVTIHPSQYASERISGRLRLIKHGPLLFMVLMLYPFVIVICHEFVILKLYIVHSDMDSI